MGFPYFGQPVLFGEPIGAQSGGAETLESYLAGLGLDLHLRLRETSGTTPVNAGALSGLTIIWTAGAGAIGQTGPNGPNEAYDYDGADSIITVTNNANLAALANATNQRWAFLVKIDSLGENTAGGLFFWGNTDVQRRLRCLSSNRLTALVATDATDAAVTTDANQIQDCIGAWAWIFMDYDDADSLGNGRRIRLWKYLLSTRTLSALTLGGGNVAATGTITNQTTNLAIGNIIGAIRTLDGQLDEVIADSGALWDTPVMQRIGDLTPNFP